jgi:hypothetical protein
MTMDLYPLFDAVEGWWIGNTIKQSVWLFPVIEAVHLLALALLGGAVLMLDLRLLGLGLTTPTPAELEGQTRPWARAALAGFFVTGVLLFTSEPLKLYGNTSFWVKMGALATVLLYTAAVRNPHARRVQQIGGRSRLIAAVSLLLWLLVAFSGRWIGFS